jgi:hypothetical protein
VPQIVTQFEAYQNALGIRTIAFHRPDSLPSGTLICPSQLLAIGSFDGQIRLLSSRSWKLAFVLPLTHPSEMADCLRGDVVMTVEVIEAEHGSTDTGASFTLAESFAGGASELSLFSAKYPIPPSPLVSFDLSRQANQSPVWRPRLFLRDQVSEDPPSPLVN